VLELDLLWIYIARQQRFDSLHSFCPGQLCKQIPQVGIRFQAIGFGGSCRTPNYAERGLPLEQTSRNHAILAFSPVVSIRHSLLMGYSSFRNVINSSPG